MTLLLALLFGELWRKLIRYEDDDDDDDDDNDDDDDVEAVVDVVVVVVVEAGEMVEEFWV